MLTFGSLFAGIGGMDLGFERVGLCCKWQVEIDDYATKVLEKHWPAVARYRDVRDCGLHNLASVDVICGGFPCQDISNAGQKGGIDGARSGLWAEFARIVGELRPGYAVVENSPALLHRGMGRVLGDLAALGYDAEWSIVSACALGAPHTRERVFIVAHANSLDGQTRMGTVTHGPLTDEPGDHGAGVGRWLLSYCGVPGVVDGFSRGVDRRRVLGNAVSPAVSEYIAQQLMTIVRERGATT